MSSWIWEFLKHGIDSGFPVEIVLLVAILLLPFPIAFFFYKLMRRQQKAIEEQTKALKDVVEKTSSVMTSIQNYINGDENITEGQAVLVYEDMINNSRVDLFDLYERTKKWLGGRDIVDHSDLAKQLETRIFNHFEAAESNLMDKLRCFKHDGRWFSEYQMTFSNEWRHIADNIYTTIANHENGIDDYLKTKFDTCTNFFNLWLKDAVGYEQRK